eukprot:3660253-Rhodomonas_salina.2
MPATEIACSATRYPVLTSRMALYLPTRCAHPPARCLELSECMVLRACYALPGTEMAYAATRWLSEILIAHPLSPVWPYAMSAMVLHTSYAVSDMGLQTPCAMSSTDATRLSPVMA